MGKFRENYFDQFGEMMIGDFEEMLHQDPQLKLYYKLLTTLLEREDYLKGEEQTEKIKTRLNELSYIIVRVQQLLIQRVSKTK